MSRDKEINKKELQVPIYLEAKKHIDYRKLTGKQLGEKYLDWYNTNFANLKKFWLNEFVYPIVFPLLSLAISHYIFHFNFTREQGIILFMLFYLTTITGRLLGKYNKLVSILDTRFDEIYDKTKRKN